MIDEQHAFEMIHFVLQAGGEKTIGIERHQATLTVQMLDFDMHRAFDIIPNVGHGKAAFLEHDGFFRSLDNSGIDVDARIVPGVLLRQIHHDDAHGHADLDRRKADAVRLVHAVEHVVDQQADFGIHLVDVPRDGFEAWIRRGKDGADGHDREIGDGLSSVKAPADGGSAEAMDLSLILLTILAVGMAVLAALIALLWGRNRAAGDAQIAPRLDALAAAQSEIAGRFAQALGGQSELQNMLAQRLEALDKRLGDSLKETATKTAETLGGIQTRLTVIDDAQKNIFALSGQVVSLQEILSNKQARGLFGQAQMEAIVADALPPGAYEFQATLSNGNRPDCVIRLPGTRTAIVIDSKFPLEAFSALRAAGEPDRKVAFASVRADMLKHVKDIAEKYLIPGETQTPAIMFVPSESIYAELHENFADVIQKAQRAQVIVVSPNILMLAITTVQTVMKDARMREQANAIQKEVGALLQDVRLLGDRVGKLQTHFGQADTDIKNILISTGKIVSRGEKIEKVELGTAAQLTDGA